MTYRREKSREEWEQELRDRQQNITPAKGLHYATIPGEPKIVSLGRFLLGNTLIAIGAAGFHYSASVLIAALAVAPGLCLFVTAIRWKDEHKPATLKL